MRMLLVAAPLPGHVFPLLPLARAARDAGHEVRLATSVDGLGGVLAGDDVPLAEVGPGLRFDRIAIQIMLRHPVIARAELAGTAGTRGVGPLFGAVNDRLLDGTVAFARRWRPDVVLYESLAVAGAVAAAEVGAPAVLHENSLFDGVTLIAATAAHLRPAARAVPPAAATIRIAPARLLATTPEGPLWPMRPIGHRGGGTVPDWLARPADLPRILVSRSTVAGPAVPERSRRPLRASGPNSAERVLFPFRFRVLRSSLRPAVAKRKQPERRYPAPAGLGDGSEPETGRKWASARCCHCRCSASGRQNPGLRDRPAPLGPVSKSVRHHPATDFDTGPNTLPRRKAGR